MRCEDLLAGLGDYFDGHRETAICQALEQHLAQCHPCQVLIDNIRQTIALYRLEQPVPLPAEVHEHICCALRQRWAARFVRA